MLFKNQNNLSKNQLVKNNIDNLLQKEQMKLRKSNHTLKEFHKLFEKITGLRHIHDSNKDLFIDNRYYEKFIIFEGLNAYFSIFSIISGVSDYQFNYGVRQPNFSSYVYFCTFFSIFLWINLVFHQLCLLEYNKKIKKVCDNETIFTSGKYKSLILSIICVFLHPNPLTVNITYTSYYPIVNKVAERKINSILTIILFTRLYFVLKYYLFSSDYMIPESQRIYKLFYFEVDFYFPIKSLLKIKPLILYIFTGFVSIFFFSLSIQIFEREIQDPFNNYLTCVYYVVVTMTTLGYGDFSPKTSEGRVIGMIACLFGVFLTSLIIISVNNLLEMTRGEQNTLNIINKVYINEEIKDSAKRVLNEFSKIIASKHSLKKENFKETEAFTPFKSSLAEFKNANIISENFSGLGSGSNIIFNSISSSISNYSNFNQKQIENKENLLKIKKEVEDLYDVILENSISIKDENDLNRQ